MFTSSIDSLNGSQKRSEMSELNHTQGQGYSEFIYLIYYFPLSFSYLQIFKDFFLKLIFNKTSRFIIENSSLDSFGSHRWSEIKIKTKHSKVHDLFIYTFIRSLALTNIKSWLCDYLISS